MKKTLIAIALLSMSALSQAAYVWTGGGAADSSSWANQDNWNLTNETEWLASGTGPGTTGSDMWDPIVLENVTVTDVALEGWILDLTLTNSHFTGSTVKFQGNGNESPVRINVDAASSLALTMNTRNQDPGTHIFNSYGTTSLTLTTDHFTNGIGIETINLGLTGSFSISSDAARTGTNAFTVNAELGNTVSGTLLEGSVYERDLLTLENFTITGAYDVNLTETEGWTLVDSVDALKAATAEGKYYFLNSSNDSGATLYTRVIPEPATASLSLLALAGLAARRRRK